MMENEMKKLNLRDIIEGMAGGYNTMKDYLNRRQQAGILHLNNAVIWMIDDEGAHIIDSKVLMDAMDAFLTVLETHDQVIKVKREDANPQTDLSESSGS